MPTPVAVAPATAPVVAVKAPVPTNGAVKPTPAAMKPPAGAQAPPVAPEGGAGEDPVVWEGKVDGKQVQITKSKAERFLSKGAFAEKVTQEAKEAIRKTQQMRAEFEASETRRKESAKKDIDAFLKEHGIDPDEYAKTKLERKVEEGKLTKEQRDALELKAENQRLKDERQKADETRQAEQRKQLTAGLQQRIENELVAAVKRAGMSANDETFYAVYESFREAFELGVLPLDGAGLPPQYADRIVEDAQAKIESTQTKLRESVLKLKGQPLLDFMGKEAVDAVLAARLEQIRSARGITPSASRAPAPTQQRKPSAYITPAEAEAQIKKLRDGGA